MKESKNNLTENEMELVSLLMKDCQSTGDIQRKLKRLFAGTIEQMLECEMVSKAVRKCMKKEQ